MFPDSASDYLYPKPGHLIEPIGEALLLHECRKIIDYEIFWNRTFNGSCYESFPVLSPNLTTVHYRVFIYLSPPLPSHAEKR